MRHLFITASVEKMPERMGIYKRLMKSGFLCNLSGKNPTHWAHRARTWIGDGEECDSCLSAEIVEDLKKVP